MATARPRRESRARKTSPIPPAPMRETISYGPSLLPGAIGTGEILTLSEAKGQPRRSYESDSGTSRGASVDSSLRSELPTSPIPPAPMRETISYGPSLLPGAIGTGEILTLSEAKGQPRRSYESDSGTSRGASVDSSL